MLGMATPDSDPEPTPNAEPVMERSAVSVAMKMNSAPPPSRRMMQRGTLSRSLSNSRRKSPKDQRNGDDGIMTNARDTSGMVTVRMRPGIGNLQFHGNYGNGGCNGTGRRDIGGLKAYRDGDANRGYGKIQ